MFQSSFRCRSTQDKYLGTGGYVCRRSRHILMSRKRLAMEQNGNRPKYRQYISSVMLSHRRDIYTGLRNICLTR